MGLLRVLLCANITWIGQGWGGTCAFLVEAAWIIKGKVASCSICKPKKVEISFYFDDHEYYNEDDYNQVCEVQKMKKKKPVGLVKARSIRSITILAGIFHSGRRLFRFTLYILACAFLWTWNRSNSTWWSIVPQSPSLLTWHGATSSLSLSLFIISNPAFVKRFSHFLSSPKGFPPKISLLLSISSLNTTDRHPWARHRRQPATITTSTSVG